MLLFFVKSLFCGVVFGILSSLAIILLRKRELVAVVSVCSVSLPHDAVGWSAVYDLGISWSYLLIVLHEMYRTVSISDFLNRSTHLNIYKHGSHVC